MPELDSRMTLVLMFVALIAGVIVGTNMAWWFQMLLVVALVILNRSRAVRQLELGALNYFFISAFLVVGCIVGNVSYILQTGPEIGLSAIKNLFIISK